MASNTNTSEQNSKRRASSAKMVKQSLRFNVDLVQVDVHSGPCAKCLRVQGKIFSINGKTPGFPILTKDVIPPIHDGCRHVLLPAPPEFLDARGEREYLQRFSCNDNLVVTDVWDYTAVRTGKSLGRERAEGEKTAQQYRSNRQKRTKRQ